MVEKIIHQIAGPKINELVDRCLESWKILNDYGFEIKIWDDDSIQSFLSEHFPFALPAVINARNYGEASDIARYLILYYYGGYYMDWDIELIDPDGFLEICDATPNGFLVIDSFNETLASECFSSQQKEPYLLSLVQDIIELYNDGLQKSLLTPKYSGPYRMRDALKKHQNAKQELIEVNDIFVYNYREIRLMPPKELIPPLIHYWMHGWR